jgi:hypothetical protein
MIHGLQHGVSRPIPVEYHPAIRTSMFAKKCAMALGSNIVMFVPPNGAGLAYALPYVDAHPSTSAAASSD